MLLSRWRAPQARAGGRLRVSGVASTIKNGGARRDRTDDLMLAKHALSQLSYGPYRGDAWIPVTSGTFKPASPTLSSSREKWWAWEDLNFRPHAYQARALTN
jgi:hypothetical protein